jgi:ketosteroid isomerase-like protein
MSLQEIPMFLLESPGWLGSVLLTTALMGCATRPGTSDLDLLQQQVSDTERAFAQTMADRNFQAFTEFIAEEAIFFSGPQPLRGKQQVTDWWKRYYEDPDAPFSWEPQQVQVLDSGTLALSSGPVHDSSGTPIATFSSIWRQEQPGVWRIVFDKGNDVCDCTTP